MMLKATSRSMMIHLRRSPYPSICTVKSAVPVGMSLPRAQQYGGNSRDDAGTGAPRAIISDISGLPDDQQGRVVTIVRPGRNTMQSAKNKMRSDVEREYWRLEWRRQDHLGETWAEPLMGWTASSDPMSTSVQMKFGSLEAAKSYCEKNGFIYEVEDITEDQVPLEGKNYADKFKRVGYKPENEDHWE